MASTLAALRFHNVPHLIGKNYEITLNQSIEALLTSLGNPNSENSSTSLSKFQELVQVKADPPLESIWGFAALTFTDPSSQKVEPFDRVIAIKDLFQLIVSCSVSCSSLKSIALVAPVIYILHNFIVDLKGLSLGSKKERKIKREIKSLVDSVVGFINVCCDGFDGNIDDLEGLIRPLGDLIRFWIVDNGVQNKNVESLRVFFPLLSNDTISRINVEGCGMADLAGFVITEAFLLKLCWKIQEECFGEKMENELKSWIVGSITGFKNSNFYVSLGSMMLEGSLPITSLVNVEHEESLRKLLFDALILVEYYFLSPESLGRLPANCAKRINFTRLVVTDKAIDLFRNQGEQTKATLYSNAFTSSSLPSQIVKCVKNEIGNDFNDSGPKGSSPRAFLRWILTTENRGIKIFDDDMSRYRDKLLSYEMMEEAEQIASGEGKKPDSNIRFYIDNKGQEEFGNDEDDNSKSMSAAFMDAAHSMESSEHGGRKRKAKKAEKTKKVKFIKYNLIDNSKSPGERSADPTNEDIGSGSAIENPDSSEEDL